MSTSENRKAQDMRNLRSREDLRRKIEHYKSKGYSNVEIARQMGLAESTVRSLLANP